MFWSQQFIIFSEFARLQPLKYTTNNVTDFPVVISRFSNPWFNRLFGEEWFAKIINMRH